MAAHSDTHAATAHALSVSDTKKQTGWLVKQKTPVRIHRFHLSITLQKTTNKQTRGHELCQW